MARKSRSIDVAVGAATPAEAAELRAPVAPLPAERVAPLTRDLDAWERGFKIGRGLQSAVARPYAEGADGKRPRDLSSKPEGDAYEAGFVAGYRSRFAGEDVPT